jgi:hypothetical protein
LILAERAEVNHTGHPEDKAAIEEQLERLLASSYFSHSRRIPSLLKFVVQETLSGNIDALKERTLGIEVFGRNASYDTAADSIVRVTAAELRKRIAQYYLESGHERELRISVPSGSYVPQFYWPSAPPKSEELPEIAAAAASGPLEPASAPHYGRFLLHLGWAVTCIIAALAGLESKGLLHKFSSHPQTVSSFWAPVLNTNDPVLFCIADQSQDPILTLRDASDLNRQIALHSDITTVVIDDLNPLVTIGNTLLSHGKTFSIKGESATNLMDLRNGPTIFIGAFDNAWTLRLTRSLRYHFFNNPEMTEFGIADSQTPSQIKWKVDRSQQIGANNSYRDYAIVARFTDPTTGKLAIVAAGVAMGGTIAAGEFLTDPDDIAQVMRGAGNRKNIEIVLSTQIINGEPGNPRLEAAYYW